MDIGTRLNNLLEGKNITQKELARCLHLAPSTINSYIKNRRQPNAAVLAELASFFDTSTDYIFGITSLRKSPSASYSAKERYLIHLYRSIPKEEKIMLIKIGELYRIYHQDK